MAELAKKLHFLKNGTEQTAKAYSTTGEAGSSYIPSKIDGVACYIPIGSPSDAMATNGRVIKSGTTYAIKSQAKPAYAEKSWTTPGSYTWTAPAGITRVRVAVCGGGGGGAAATSSAGVARGGSGGTSKFDSLIQATGGGGGYANLYTSGDSEVEYRYSGGSGGSPNGRAGTGYASTTLAGGTGFALSFSLANDTYGNGGGCAITAGGGPVGSGGSGGYDTGYVDVTSGTTYTVIVGGGGSGSTLGRYCTASAGNSGFVYIAYGGDI